MAGVEPMSVGSPLVRAFDRKAKGYLQSLQRSFSSSALDRNSLLAEEDPSTMTIEFLRARLQSQRADYRAEKQRAQVLARKVLELEYKLSIEVQLRERAEYGNVDASKRHGSECMGPDDSSSSDGRLDETSEEHGEQGYGGFSSRLLSSSPTGDSDGEGHFKVSSWQSCSHCRGPRSLNNRKMEHCQSLRYLCHWHPSRSPQKKEYNEFSTDKDSCNSKSMGRWTHKKMRRRQGQGAGNPDYHDEHHESDINAVQMKTELIEQEAEKALQPYEGKLEQKNASTSLQFKGSNVWQHAKNLSSLSMGSKEDSSHNTTFGAQMHVECCANCCQELSMGRFNNQMQLFQEYNVPRHSTTDFLTQNHVQHTQDQYCYVGIAHDSQDSLQNLNKNIAMEDNEGFGFEVFNGTMNGAESYRDQWSRQVTSDGGSTLLRQGKSKAGSLRRPDGYYMQQPHLHYGVSPLTKKVESGISSLLHRDAVPSQFLALQGDLDQCGSHATHSTSHLIRSVDGGFNTVREMLEVLEVTKQPVQTADKQLELPDESGQHAASQAALVRTGRRRHLLGRCQSPSRFCVETAAPNHLHFSSTSQQ